MNRSVASRCVAVVVLALTACSVPEGHQPADPPRPEPLEYPTFEVATSSRMFGLIGGDLGKVDLAELAEQLQKFDGINSASRTFAEQLTGTQRGGEPTAELLPKIPPPEKSIYMLVPLVMMKLEPLWHTPTWSSEQVELADRAKEILARIDGAPALGFETDDDDANRASLERLVRWFHAATARPEALAAMIFTLDDGPFVGLPYAATSVLPATQRKRVDERTELSLTNVDREAEPWVMQCLRDGEPLWTRVVSGLPHGEVVDVRFVDVAPRNLGAYGWHVPFRVNWKYGREQAHLYLGSEGDLLFYFLSW